MMSQSTVAIAYAQQNRPRFLKELEAFAAIPSVSTLSEHKPDMQRAAEWLTAQMREIGLENVAVVHTEGNPLAYGEWLHAPGKPTVLVYGHYDVVPADPFDEWISPPFTPTIRGENFYARGASDMKGNIHETLKALEALQRTGGLPVNVKVLFEGEEEVDSKSLGQFITQHADTLRCDLCLNADSGILNAETPAIISSLRGIICFDVWVYGPAQDLHSGVFGGTLHNPAQVLCDLVSGMHDENGRITLPGFYDRVHDLTPQERADYAAFPLNEAEWKATAGVSELWGEQNFSTNERRGARPTLDVNGLFSGFTGEGSKTVLPAKAMAKLSMRLVPYQDPAQVEQQLKDYFALHAPSTVRWQVDLTCEGSPGILLDRNSLGAHAAAAALRDTFGKEPAFIANGGTIPIVPLIQAKLHIDTVLLGFTLPDDKFHGPNEKLHLPTYYRGIETFIRFFENIAA